MGVDADLARLLAERAALEQRFAAGTLPADEMGDAGKRLKQVADDIENLELRWLELSTDIEYQASKAR